MGVRIQRPGEPGHPGGNRKIYVRVDYRGHRKTRTFTTKKGSDDYAATVEALLTLGKVEDVFRVDPASPPQPPVTFGMYWSRWFSLEQAGWKPRTVAAYERQRNTHLKQLAGRPIAEITRQEVKDFLAGKLAAGNLRRDGKPMQANTVKGILTPLGKCLQAAADDGLIPNNPAARVRVICRNDKTKANQLERYTREELAHILQTAQVHMLHWYPALLATARTGMRVGELCGLRVEDLHFDQRYIHIRRAISRRIEGTPKNGRDRRVDMSAQLAVVLQDHLRAREIAATVAGKEPTPWAFGSLETGRPLCDEVLAKEVWPRLLKLAGARKLKFHSLRHTFASLLIEQGESLAYIQDQLGHSSIQITVDTYGHLVPGANRGAVDRLDDPPEVFQDATRRNPDATLAVLLS